MSDYDMSIHSNQDASAWAKFYKSTFKDADEDLMHAWFANAMMAMHDHLYREKIVPLEKERDELKSRKRLNRIIELALDYWLSQDENTTIDDVARYVEKELEVSE